MSTPADRGWGAACPPSSQLVTIRVDNTNFRVHRRVAWRFEGFLKDLVATGYSLDEVADDWGLACRKIAGTNTWSNHAWGLAIDVNATRNPHAYAHPEHAGKPGHDSRGRHTDMNVPVVQKLADKWGFRWGINYRKPDAMHFEWMGTPAEADRTGPVPDRHAPIDNTAPQHQPQPAAEENEMLCVAVAEGGGACYLLQDGYKIRIANWDGRDGKDANFSVVKNWADRRIVLLEMARDQLEAIPHSDGSTGLK